MINPPKAIVGQFPHSAPVRLVGLILLIQARFSALEGTRTTPARLLNSKIAGLGVYGAILSGADLLQQQRWFANKFGGVA